MSNYTVRCGAFNTFLSPAKPLSQSMLKQVSNLYWNQLDQITEVHQFASVLDKPTGEIDRNLEALQTRCISQPQLVAPVTELRELVNLLRRRGDGDMNKSSFIATKTGTGKRFIHQMALVRKDQFWTLDLVMYTSKHPGRGLLKCMKQMKDMKRYEMRSRSFVGVQIRNLCDNLESYLLRRFQLT